MNDYMRNDDNCVCNESIRTNRSVGNEFTENIRDVVSTTDTRNDTNDVLSNSEPTPRDVTCSTAATMSGITTFGATNMYPGATIVADDATTERGRKINAQDIQNIFVSILFGSIHCCFSLMFVVLYLYKNFYTHCFVFLYAA